MKKILFVEDDALIARVYTQKLAEAGFDIAMAENGAAAVELLPQFQPDVVVLDLLMPKMTGSDVLKFMREHPEFKTTRVIVFSNSFLTNLVEQVASISSKVEAALVKADVTPARLIEVINKVLANPPHSRTALAESGYPARDFSKTQSLTPTTPFMPPSPEPEIKLLRPRTPANPPPAPPRSATPPPRPVTPPTAPAIMPPPLPAATPAPAAPTAAPQPIPPAPVERKPVQPASAAATETDTEFVTRMGRQFLERSPIIFKDLRQICREFIDAEGTPAETERLIALNRKLGFLTQMTGFAGYHRSAELCSALEALIFELLNKPQSINDSSRQTIAATIAFLAQFFDGPAPAKEQSRSPAKILVVDDDAVSNRVVVDSLGRAMLPATSLTDPLEALKNLEQTTYDLALLDINMPGMDGPALCEQMRLVPANKRTPVIFITSSSDFKTRARSVLSGGNDLIVKPISPTELCVKVLTHLQKGG